VSNFQFISSQFKDIYAAAIDAESNAATKPIVAGMYTRQAMELMLNWVYWMDHEYELPYQNTLAAKIRDENFQRDVPPAIIRELEFIRKVGNNAVHTRKISVEQSVIAVKHLFHWCQYVVKTYTELEYPNTFDEKHLSKEDKEKETLKEIGLLRETLETQRQVINNLKKEQEEAIDNDVVNQLRKEIAQLKEKNKGLPVPEPIVSEAITRKHYIDAEIISAGWDLEAENTIEYKLDNFPKHINPTGTGYVDYVLWGDNGLPLAVVEAKRTCEKVEKGKRQATVYADCLEKKFNQRPIIIYTNGLQIWFWDDRYAIPRRVHGYYTKDELQLIIERRRTRKDLSTIQINDNITNRYYQKEAIQSVFEKFQIIKDGGIIQNSRKALLVMATGTGKTRTAISIVDLMMKANWVKKVLFLADRNALVTQAKRAFTELLPDYSSIDLTKEREAATTRLVFSTYKTMMNRIDSEESVSEVNYGVGHFELIIVDEAHRSIYNKYRDIFNYFDGLVVGLTATPREDADKDTYEFFNCEVGDPTYYYELDEAVKVKYLTPPKKVTVPTKFLERGIKYKELPEEEQKKFEESFAQYGEELPEEINSTAINRWLFNEDTVIKILDVLMQKGYKVDSGDTIGKTIVFAKNQKHAEFIEKIFNEQYPEYTGHFCHVITHQDKYAQDSIDKFKIKDRDPRIAISVDMLDTGIDVPELLNLVFFKPVYSKSKFWQMIGRGTRLCEDLFGPGADKEDFLIFDCCRNFEYFDINPDGKPSTSLKSLTHRIFETRILLAETIKNKATEDDNLSDLRKQLLDVSHQHNLDLYNQRDSKFSVKMRIEEIEKYSIRESWDDLNFIAIKELSTAIGPIVFLDDTDEKAKQFDLLLYSMEKALLDGDPRYESGKTAIKGNAARLEKLANLNAIKEKLSIIQRVQSDKFWENMSIPTLEFVRMELRELMKLLPTKDIPVVFTNIKDELGEVSEPSAIILPTVPENYIERVTAFVKKNSNHIVIDKLKKNLPITQSELDLLEQFLFDGDERGTKEDFIKATGNEKPLGSFIRSIVGLDRNAALSAFSEFMNAGSLSANQQRFINMIINHFVNEGVINLDQLYGIPYTNIHMSGIDGIFNDQQADRIVSILKSVNNNVGQKAS
jgi:type I restriction enzyme R subunit